MSRRLRPELLQPAFKWRVHNYAMNALLPGLMLMALLAPVGFTPLHAQQSADTGDDTSRQVEESDEAFRRRMELEDARQRDLGYTPPPDTYPEKQEKINKLPEESRDNIREQLVDMIVENGDWEPSDALEEQPYRPTSAAMADPELMQQEQEAWDEQIEKYNKREAAAYGALRGPVPGPGNPTGEEGAGQEGSEGDGAGQTGGQEGGPGSAGEDQESGQEENPGSAGTYQPYQSNRSRSDDTTSTAGVQQSALDFLKGQQGQVQGTASVPNAQGSAQPTAQSSVAQSSRQSAAQSSQVTEQPEQVAEQPEQVTEQPEQAPQDAGSSETVEIDLSTPGIIAIKDLDKLEGTETPESPEDPERR